MVNQVVALYHGLKALNTENEITLKINSQGEHHESYWGEEFFQAANSEFVLRSKLSFLAGADIVPVGLGDSSALIGAAAIARRKIGET